MDERKHERIKDTMFEVVLAGMVIWCFVILICLTLMIFVPMIK